MNPAAASGRSGVFSLPPRPFPPPSSPHTMRIHAGTKPGNRPVERPRDSLRERNVLSTLQVENRNSFRPGFDRNDSILHRLSSRPPRSILRCLEVCGVHRGSIRSSSSFRFFGRISGSCSARRGMRKTEIRHGSLPWRTGERRGRGVGGGKRGCRDAAPCGVPPDQTA